MIIENTYVVLRKNIDPQGGLMNGAIGYLIRTNVDNYGCIESLDIDFGDCGIITLFKSNGYNEENFPFKNFPISLKNTLSYHQCNK